MAEKKKMHVKKDDNVVIITGKDAGKQGKIIDVDTKNGRVFVDKLNLVVNSDGSKSRVCAVCGADLDK